jgi:hypothetical protein
MLLVPDHGNRKDFVKAAKQIHDIRHKAVRERGRPSDRGYVFPILWKYFHPRRKLPSRKTIINVVRNQLPPHHPMSDDAILKHLKQWIIFADRGQRNSSTIVGLRFDRLSRPRLAWLKKHAPKTINALGHYQKLLRSGNREPQGRLPTLEMLKECIADGKVNLRKLFKLAPFDLEMLKAESKLSQEIDDMFPRPGDR